jgi:hypothetical protein
MRTSTSASLCACLAAVVISMVNADILPEIDIEGRSSLELGDHYQGDIILTSEQKKLFSAK